MKEVVDLKTSNKYFTSCNGISSSQAALEEVVELLLCKE
jgi:hypothetical protein